MTRLVFGAVVVAALAGCGKDTKVPNSGGPDGPGGAKGSDASVVQPDVDTAAGWVTLIGRDWSIAAGSTNNYECTRIQVMQDTWVSGFHSVEPQGTHHLVLTIDPDDTQTGDYDCSASSGTVNGTDEMIYAAGLNTDDYLFPSGVAVHIPAGTWINLNLHLFDATDYPLTGNSGIQIKTVAAADVVNPADFTFSGTLAIDIPANSMGQAVGGCAAPADWHAFALWPHMHQIGIHQKFVFTPPGGNPTTLLDTDYEFTEQKFYPITETVIPKNSQITTTCMYDNTTNAAVLFGQSSTQEMCFTGIYKYPAGSTTFGCVAM